MKIRVVFVVRTISASGSYERDAVFDIDNYEIEDDTLFLYSKGLVKCIFAPGRWVEVELLD